MASSSTKNLSFGAALCVLLLPIAAGGTTPIGQIVSPQATVDGVEVPAGTTVMSPTVLEAGDETAVVRLLDGTLVGLDRSSRARLDAGGSGEVLVAVLAGEAAYRAPDGSLAAIGEGISTTLDQAVTEVGGGEAIDPDEEIAICHLEDWSPASRRAGRPSMPRPELVELCTQEPENEECSWVRLEVRMAELAMHLDHGDVYAKKDLRTPEMDEEIDCRRIGAWWWLSALAVLPAIEDDDTAAVAASPIVP